MCACAQRCPFRVMFPDASHLAIDLMEKMLQFNPERRITVEQALAHPYLAQMHDPASELSAPGEPLLVLAPCMGFVITIFLQ